MLVGTLILTMMPVTATEFQEASELKTEASSQAPTEASSQAAAAQVDAVNHTHSLKATISAGGVQTALR
jgi:uncharacterized protein YpmB